MHSNACDDVNGCNLLRTVLCLNIRDIVVMHRVRQNVSVEILMRSDNG